MKRRFGDTAPMASKRKGSGARTITATANDGPTRADYERLLRVTAKMAEARSAMLALLAEVDSIAKQLIGTLDHPAYKRYSRIRKFKT